MIRENLLRVDNLCTEFYSENEVVTAVDHINFKVDKGETLGIVGESGSGKSVTCLSLMQLIASPPGNISSGSALLMNKQGNEVDLLGMKEHEIRPYRGNEIAMIFQEPMTSLNPVYTCGDQVSEAIMLHQKTTKKEAYEITVELFKKVKLKNPQRIFSSYPHQLSGGQKQRVMIAMAISCKPSLLIADEPTTALDVTIQKTILELLIEIQESSDMSIIFITHDLGVIAEICDRVIVMYKGRIVEEDSLVNIFVHPRQPYTKGLIACRPPLEKRLHWLPTITDFMKVDAFGSLSQKEVSIEDVTKKLILPESEVKVRHDKLYVQEPLLSVKNLKTWYVRRRSLLGKPELYTKAVDDVSFEVYPGETLGLVGESGCGKTTLGKSIIGLAPVLEGEILYKEVDITKLRGKELREFRRNLQIIFQDPYSSLNPGMTIGEAIMEPMRVHGILDNDTARKKRVVELLERVNMREMHYHRYPHEFSGGQRQRICIARTLSLNPEFIICDESVSALDVSIQAQVLNLLNELRDEFGFTYIFISHDLSVVKFMSDRMMVMNEGKIEEIDVADKIYSNPKSEYTVKLIDAIPKGRQEDIEARIKRRNKKLLQAG